MRQRGVANSDRGSGRQDCRVRPVVGLPAWTRARPRESVELKFQPRKLYPREALRTCRASKLEGALSHALECRHGNGAVSVEPELLRFAVIKDCKQTTSSLRRCKEGILTAYLYYWCVLKDAIF